MSVQDFLNIELVNDNLKKFDQSWEETLGGSQKQIFWKAFAIDTWTSPLSCKML